MLTTWYTSLVDGLVRRDGDFYKFPKKIAGVSSITEFVKVRGGSFKLGKSEKNRGLKDLPRHTATLTYDYFIGKYLVTEETFARFNTNFEVTNPYIPITDITWFEAIEFCNDISRLNNLPVAYDLFGNLLDKYGKLTTDITQVVGYRLPTETEWEFAATGAVNELNFQFAGGNIIDYVGWYKDNSAQQIHEVGQLQPNTLGIFDLTGNVNEWCYDSFQYGEIAFYKEKTNNIGIEHTNTRIVRGGSWTDPAQHCTIDYRDYCAADKSYSVLGFRLVRTII